MQTMLLIVHLIVCAGLIGLVLVQRSEGGALGIGGGGNAILSGRGAASALARATTVAGIIFFCTSIILALLAGRGLENRGRSVTDTPVAERSAPVLPESAPTQTAAAAPSTPDIAVAPSPAVASERAGPADLAPAVATPQPRQIAAAPTQPAPRTTPPASTQPRPTSTAQRPATTQPTAAESTPPPPAVTETPAVEEPPAATEPRRRAGPDQ